MPGAQYFGVGANSGRKSGVAISASNPNTSYVATAGGGVWKSVNNGASYKPLSDTWSMQYTTCVAVDPTNPNRVFVGTGDFHGTMKTGIGIMGSSDGGTTWTQMGAAEFGTSTITRIWIKPSNTDTLVALAAGGDSAGIYRSTDGGSSWAAQTAPAAEWQDMDVSADGTMFACSITTGVYRSSDEGISWLPVATPIPALAGGDKWDLAVSKRDSSILFLATINEHVFRSTDGGQTWTDVGQFIRNAIGASNPGIWTYAYGGQSIETRPTADGNNDFVAFGLSSVVISNDGGATWVDSSRTLESGNTASKVCMGQFGITFYPGSEVKLMVATHGGLYRGSITAANVSTWENLNATFYDDEMQNVTVHPTDPFYVIGGTGILGGAGSRGTPTTGPWHGMYWVFFRNAAFDLTNPGTHYTSNVGGIWRFANATTSIPSYWGSFTSDFSLRVPLIMVGAAGSRAAYGYGGVVRINTGFDNFWTNHNTGGGSIRVLSRSRHTPDGFFTGAENGDIYFSGDLGQTFKKIDGNLPNGSINSVEEDPTAANGVLASVNVGGVPALYYCADASALSPVWVIKAGSGATGLPELTINDAVQDPLTKSYYVANDVGVFVSPDLGLNWYNMNSLGMPNLKVTDLWVYSYNGVSFLYAGTDGRGIWRCYLSNRFISAVQIAKADIYGGQQNTITVKLNGSAPIGTVVQLSDSSPNVSIPTSINMPQGSTQTTFTAFTTNPATTQTVSITAKTWESTGTNSFTLHAVPNFTYTPESSDIYGGNKFTCAIDLGVPAPMTTVVTFSDTLTEVASPSSTSLAPGQTTKNVTLHTLTVASATSGTVSAKIANTTVTSSVTLQPRPDLTSLSVIPSSVQGGTSTTGRITMSFATGGNGQPVAMTDSSTIVTTPSTVLAGPGIDTDFTIGTSAVTATYNVTVKATLRGVTRTTVLSVHP